MSRRGEECGIGAEALLDYVLGDLPPGHAEELEEHLFACAGCGARLEALERLRDGVSAVARGAELAVNANEGLLERLSGDGLTRREYRIPAGGAVLCAAGPEDLVVVRLAADYHGLHSLRLDAEVAYLEGGSTVTLPVREVAADRERDEVILVFPGSAIRSYPRSRWTMRLRGEGPAGPAEVGSFVMDHTP